MTTTFNLVRNQIIFKACRQAGILEQGETPEAAMLETAADYLNTIVKDLEVYRKKLWSIETIRVAISQSSSVTHNDETYYCTQTHTSSADTEPGVGDLWEAYWYKLELSDSTPTAWALATDYTNGGEITAEDGTASIESAYLLYNDNSYPLDVINRFQEVVIDDKWRTAQPEGLRYDRPNNKIILYPIPDQDYILIYNRVRLLEDILTASDTIDVPQTLFSYLIFELANWLAEEYQQEEAKIRRLAERAQGKLAMALRNQKEHTDDKFINPAYD